MWYYLKQVLFAFAYLLFMLVIAAAITLIKNTLVVILLLIVNAGLFNFLMFITFNKEGQESVGVLHANDLERKQIILTGEDRPLKLHEEYKPWKGFMFGLLTAAPMVFCILLNTILYLAVPGYKNAAAGVGNIIYLMFTSFIYTFNGGIVALTFGQTFYALLVVPYLALSTGIPYLLGAKKRMGQYDKIKKTHELLYGEIAEDNGETEQK